MAQGLRINPENGRAWAERVAAEAARKVYCRVCGSERPDECDAEPRHIFTPPRARRLVVVYDITDLNEDQVDLLVGEAEAQAERTKSSGYYVEGRWVEDGGKPDVPVKSHVEFAENGQWLPE